MTTDRHAELFANYRHLVAPAEPDEIEHLQRQIYETRATSLSGAAAQIEMVLLEHHSDLGDDLAQGLENALATIERLLGKATPHPDGKLLAALRRVKLADERGAYWHDRDDARREAWSAKWCDAMHEAAETPAATLPGCIEKVRLLVEDIRGGKCSAAETMVTGLLADLQRMAKEARS
ncbi:MAG TPA: hypothetical protein PKA13_21595 [Geminicoccaceae bacterium]|nr:hypothetical protein [Geminicoccaceae bacterium]